MAETIESFVAKLQAEGVVAGRTEADKIAAKARKDAEAILAQAQAQAKKITDDAQAQAAATLAKSKTDLQLAARDTALRLREALTRAVRAALAAGAKQTLTDAKFLGSLLHDIVMQYVQANLGDRVTMKINVTPEMQQALAAWALKELHQKAEAGKVSLDLKGALAEAGFEYQVDGANIEVTLTSVVDTLADLVSPALRDLLEQALAGEKR